MNLWDIQGNEWSTKLLEIVGVDATDLSIKLGRVELEVGAHLGDIHSYFSTRYNFRKSISTFTKALTIQIVSLSRSREIILPQSHRSRRPTLCHSKLITIKRIPSQPGPVQANIKSDQTRLDQTQPDETSMSRRITHFQRPSMPSRDGEVHASASTLA